MPRRIALASFVSLLPLVAANAAAPPAHDVLTEFSAAEWGAVADGSGTAAVYDDATRVKVGSAALRFETEGCFDTWLYTPAAEDAGWDFLAAGSGGLQFWVYSENDNIGFQGSYVDLHTAEDDYFRYTPNYDFMHAAWNQWHEVIVPLNGDDTWTRTTNGTPDLSNINYVEIHGDTWGCGFTAWIDGLSFDVDLAPPEGLLAVAGNGQVELQWKPWNDPSSLFDHYAVYRSTSPIEDTAGLTPIATYGDIAQAGHIDSTAANGVGYHYALTVVFTGGETSAAAVGPRVPRDETDLQITCISRLPRYPRYCPQYTGYELSEPSGYGPYHFTAATGLGCDQTSATQRWPLLDDVVEYVATVRNRGTNTWTGTLGGTWRVDGSIVSTPTQAVALAPGETVTFAQTWSWDGDMYEIEFSLDVMDAREENNTRTIWTRSAPFLTYVDISAIEKFRDVHSPNYPLAVTDDFLDWLQHHAAEMNRMFAEKGSSKRIHYDVLAVLHDYDAEPASPERINFGIFPFRYEGASDWDPRSPGYYRAAPDIDYGLVHEMAHQLGIIDIYRLSLGAAANHVSGLGYSPPSGLMSGVAPYFSDHTALAMEHWADHAHGYYGQYLYCMPETIQIRILDYLGEPVSGATVKMYQKAERPGQGEIIADEIKAQGTTTADGVWTLPNVPICAVGPCPSTYAGDQLWDNPFGWVAVVGSNGLLHFKVEWNGFVDYCWLDITEVNVAFWQGQTGVAQFDRQLSIGGEVQAYPPADLAEENAENWSSWAQDGTITLSDDAGFKHDGDASLRGEFTGGADNYVRYPQGLLARWDLSEVQAIRFWAYADNPNLGFQSASPRVRLGSFADGYFQWTPAYDILNNARNQWYEFVIPINGDATWTRATSGTPDLAEINYLQIHADTWGYGFTLWLDGVRFDPPPAPEVCLGDSNCDGAINWRDIDFFVAAQNDNESGWAGLYESVYGTPPPCPFANNDVDESGSVNWRDIDPFVAAQNTDCQ